MRWIFGERERRQLGAAKRKIEVEELTIWRGNARMAVSERVHELELEPGCSGARTFRVDSGSGVTGSAPLATAAARRKEERVGGGSSVRGRQRRRDQCAMESGCSC